MKIELKAGHGTILERIEELGHATEFQCRSGYCGSCSADLIAGDIFYKTKPRAFCARGQIIICCAQAKTDIIITINE